MIRHIRCEVRVLIDNAFIELATLVQIKCVDGLLADIVKVHLAIVLVVRLRHVLHEELFHFLRHTILNAIVGFYSGLLVVY